MIDLESDIRAMERIRLLTLGWTMKVNEQPYMHCRKHGAVPVFSVQPPKRHETVKLCQRCFEEEFTNFAIAEPDPNGEPIRKPLLCIPSKTPSSEDYTCQYEDIAGNVCDKPTNYHNSCMGCKTFFCEEHLKGSFMCEKCLADYDGAMEPKWMN